MLRWTGWTPKQRCWRRGHCWKIAEFLSLTRGAWLGLVVGYLAYALSSSPENAAAHLHGRQHPGFLMPVVIASFPCLRTVVTRSLDSALGRHG